MQRMQVTAKKVPKRKQNGLLWFKVHIAQAVFVTAIPNRKILIENKKSYDDDHTSFYS